MRPFLNKSISNFNAIAFAHSASRAGLGVNLVTTDRDDYFQLSGEERDIAVREFGLTVITLPGEHDELPLRPVQTLENYFNDPSAHAAVL